ncbi:BTB/POZ domain-containing protein [Aphelenchoides avenae]|nr:BTB/POZ domain-containing protein [Aphelenchus avenae]
MYRGTQGHFVPAAIAARGRGRVNDIAYADQGPLSVHFSLEQLQNGPVHSNVRNLGCIPWSMTVSTQDNTTFGRPDVNVTVNCLQNANALANFTCSANIGIRLVPNKPGEKRCDYKRLPTMTFDASNMEQTCIAFMNYYQLMDKKDLFAKENGQFEVEAWINISRSRFDLYPQNDFSIGGDAVLVVGERRFHVDKSYLSVHSPYFDRLFFGAFNEANRHEIRLNEVDPDDFLKFLRAIYPSAQNTVVTAENVEALVVLSDEFNAEALKAQCQAFLCSKLSDVDISNAQKFILAERGHLDQVKLHVMKRTTTSFALNAIKRTNFPWSASTLGMLQRKKEALDKSSDDLLNIIDE